ncbi:hypothetical protein OROMI_014361 [Orobanche minor]
MMNGSSLVLPFEGNNEITEFDYDKCRPILAKGVNLNIETSNGRDVLRSVAVILKNRKVVLQTKKLNRLNALARQKDRKFFFG